MKMLTMHGKRIARSILLVLMLSACSSNPNRTHRGELIEDKVTEQRVQSELSRAGPDFKGIHVQSTNGVVVLSGTASSSQIRARAEKIARGVGTAIRLRDEVRVGQ
jgi:hypothetical protein